MNFISNLHFKYFVDSFTKYKQLNDNYYCAFAYVKSFTEPISDDDDFYEDIYEQYLSILKEGLPADVKKDLRKLIKIK